MLTRRHNAAIEDAVVALSKGTGVVVAMREGAARVGVSSVVEASVVEIFVTEIFGAEIFVGIVLIDIGSVVVVSVGADFWDMGLAHEGLVLVIGAHRGEFLLTAANI